jgi:hypothetical protein
LHGALLDERQLDRVQDPVLDEPFHRRDGPARNVDREGDAGTDRLAVD